MKKTNAKRIQKESKAVTPEEAIQFLEDMRKIQSEIDEKSTPISIRIPANILRSLKLRAKADGKKYQSLLIEYLRKGLRES